MPGETVRHEIPYPLGSDPASTLDTIGKAVAERLDALMGQSGQATVNIVAAAQGTEAIVFDHPVSFGPPKIVLGLVGSAQYVASIATAPAATANGFTLIVRRTDAAASTVNIVVNWLAIPFS